MLPLRISCFDGIDNPKPIPDLAGPKAALKVPQDPATLAHFIHRETGKLLGLPYPGGPEVERQTGWPAPAIFPGEFMTVIVVAVTNATYPREVIDEGLALTERFDPVLNQVERRLDTSRCRSRRPFKKTPWQPRPRPGPVATVQSPATYESSRGA